MIKKFIFICYLFLGMLVYGEVEDADKFMKFVVVPFVYELSERTKVETYSDYVLDKKGNETTLGELYQKGWKITQVAKFDIVRGMGSMILIMEKVNLSDKSVQKSESEPNR